MLFRSGAYGGRADIMDLIAPQGPVYQAGTLAGNPLAVAAGIAMLEELKRRTVLYTELDGRAARLAEGLQEIAVEMRIPTCVNRVGSMLTLFFTPGPVTDWATADACSRSRFARFFQLMLDRSVLLPPSQFEAWFVSAAHTDKDVDTTLEAAEAAFLVLAQEAAAK